MAAGLLSANLILTAGLLGILKNRRFLLVTLLSIEMASVGLYSVLLQAQVISGQELFVVLYFLVVTVGTGVIGLTMLTGAVFSFKSDQLKGFSSLVW
uniref:NADH-ubiquinone oxidoreductase chain 4L n=1 Tax=Bactrurus brachycaudus TaxID=111554 RepID=A0A6C0X5J2_9CRUS|nr:NADH dehydrogenase subunit 4L [Bactrurus brachycaudus]QIC54388.1 NADH dehydrogenase subunit 4L [Bactrurus brachycaudus]